MQSTKIITNRILGFTPYKIGNQIGWKKEITFNDGYKHIFKKLPSGSILKETIDSNGVTWAKQGIFKNGKEMYSYIRDSLGGRAIHISNTKGPGLYALTKKYYNFVKKKYEPMVTKNNLKHLYSFIEKLKMNMGIG